MFARSLSSRGNRRFEILIDRRSITFQPADCSTESSTASSENEVDKNVSMSEVTDITQKEGEEILEDSVSKPTALPLDKVKAIFAAALFLHYTYFVLNVSSMK